MSNLSFNDLFSFQMMNQQKMLNKGMYEGFKLDPTSKVPVDDIRLASYHVQHLISEVGEVLDADKRWKNFRNEKYDKKAKAEEIADCFIVLMNIAMYSDIDGEFLSKIIEVKMNEVGKRIK